MIRDGDSRLLSTVKFLQQILKNYDQNPLLILKTEVETSVIHFPSVKGKY